MVGKRVLKKKAKDAVPTIDPESKKPNKSAVALLIASVLIYSRPVSTAAVSFVYVPIMLAVLGSFIIASVAGARALLRLGDGSRAIRDPQVT